MSALPLVIVIDGAIGAGKTEFTNALVEEAAKRVKADGRRLLACAVPEPVKLWEDVGALPLFYRDPQRYAYTFQTYVYATRVTAIADAVRDNPHADIFVLDRSPATDRVFMDAQDVSPVERAMYDTWCNAHDRMLPIDLRRATGVYLQTSLETCMARVARRARGGDAATDRGLDRGALPLGVTTAYQAELIRRHDAFLLGADGAPPTCPYRRVVCVPAAVADADFTVGSPDRAAIANALLDELLSGSVSC